MCVTTHTPCLLCLLLSAPAGAAAAAAAVRVRPARRLRPCTEVLKCLEPQPLVCSTGLCTFVMEN